MNVKNHCTKNECLFKTSPILKHDFFPFYYYYYSLRKKKRKNSGNQNEKKNPEFFNITVPPSQVVEKLNLALPGENFPHNFLSFFFFQKIKPIRLIYISYLCRPTIPIQNKYTTENPKTEEIKTDKNQLIRLMKNTLKHFKKERPFKSVLPISFKNHTLVIVSFCLEEIKAQQTIQSTSKNQK